MLSFRKGENPARQKPFVKPADPSSCMFIVQALYTLEAIAKLAAAAYEFVIGGEWMALHGIRSIDFFDDCFRAQVGFVKNSPQIFTDNTQHYYDQTKQESNERYDCREPCGWNSLSHR